MALNPRVKCANGALLGLWMKLNCHAVALVLQSNRHVICSERCLKWGGGGSLRDLSKNILKQEVGKGKS